MGDAHRSVFGTLLTTFPLTTSFAAAILLFAVSGVLRHKGRPTRASALWLWPLYLWGLESICGILDLFGWGDLNNPALLRAWQRLIFTALYCLVGVIAVEWLDLRLEHGAEGPVRLKRGRDAWCHALVIGDVLLNLSFFFALFFAPWRRL